MVLMVCGSSKLSCCPFRCIFSHHYVILSLNIMPNSHNKFAIRNIKLHKVIVISVVVPCYMCSRRLDGKEQILSFIV